MEIKFEEEKCLDQLEEMLEYLNKKQKLDGIIFVHGKGKRKTPLQRYIEQIEDCKEKQQKYSNYNSLFDGRNSFSKTDTDATFMHMKEDHMRNSQLKPGYNIQIGVENEYIIAMDVYSERNDQLTFIPFMDELEKNLDIKYSNIVADAGYESEENLTYLTNKEQNAFIKPSTYEKQKKRSYKNEIGRRENMDYNSDEDYYICHNDKRLVHILDGTRTSKSGYVANIKIYECEDCSNCSYKSKCTKSRGNRRLQVSPNFIEKREVSFQNITSETGIILRMNRSIQVEGAFGVLKQDYGFRRFLTRGKRNVKMEFLLLSFGFNINKLHNRIMYERVGKRLFKQQKEAS
jgi:transposase